MRLRLEGHPLINKTIAIVDDDELVRRSMSSLVRSVGLQARTFGSADELLAMKEATFDCVISDVQMPGMSGLELQQILSRRRNPPPFIVITAHAKRSRDAALAAGATCFLEKPVDGDQLIMCLEAVLGWLDK